ncbi:hypothetical protein D9M69_453770 [compost metagenome]
MRFSRAESVWRDAKHKGQYRYAVVEIGLLPDAPRLRLLQSDRPKQPLMQQREFAPLQAIGPWLLDVSDLEFAEFLTLEPFRDTPALMGWIRTDCPLNKLSEHLGDALLAKDDTDTVYLLRSYLPTTLPLLHARTDAAWRDWLFGPLHDWWLPQPDQGWQCLTGLGLDAPADYQPIHLDSELWQALELDPLVYSLTGELERHAPEVFTSPCHGDRLDQVKRAIEAGRDEGLLQRQDLSLFATLQLFDRQFPADWPKWPQTMALVREQGIPLAQAIRMLPE